MIKSQMINKNIQEKVLEGKKVSHSTSYPVIYKEADKYYLAFFVFFFSKEDIEAGMVERPSMWGIADIENGELIAIRKTVENEFSKASYEIKYDVRSKIKYDTSKKYYDDAFEMLDRCRCHLIEQNEMKMELYERYLDKILANIPEPYQQFYRDLSI